MSQPGLTQADVQAALLGLGIGQNQGLNGVPMPYPIAGVGGLYPPHWACLTTASGTTTTTAGRLYYIPYYFPYAGVAYTGLKMRNQGAGDNAEALRLGVYRASKTTGLPSTLVVDAGEITLTGAAADRTLATAWTSPYVGWGYLAYAANTAVDVAAMSAGAAAALTGQSMPQRHAFGIAITTAPGTFIAFAGYYVDTAYGAFAANAVAPTGIINNDYVPTVYPYIT